MGEVPLKLALRTEFPDVERFLANVLCAIARPSVVCLSVTLVRPTQAVQMFGNISTELGTLAI